MLFKVLETKSEELQEYLANGGNPHIKETGANIKHINNKNYICRYYCIEFNNRHEYFNVPIGELL